MKREYNVGIHSSLYNNDISTLRFERFLYTLINQVDPILRSAALALPVKLKFRFRNAPFRFRRKGHTQEGFDGSNFISLKLRT